MKQYTKKEIIKILQICAKKYKENLLNKNIMFIHYIYLIILQKMKIVVVMLKDCLHTLKTNLDRNSMEIIKLSMVWKVI